MSFPVWSLPAALGASAAALVVWNFALGARLSALPSMGRGFRALSALCAFLFLPALVIGLLAPTAPGARVLGPLVWLWPLAAIAVLLQSVWAATAGRASRLVTLPIVLFDFVVAWIVVSRWVEGLGAALPAWALAPGVAVSTFAAAAFGPDAFLWGATALVPALAPAAPARWRLGRVARVAAATACTTAVAATAAAGPRAFDAVQLAQALKAGPLAAPAHADLAIGLRLFGTLTSTPSAAVARSDVALADSLGVTALHVELAWNGLTGSALDSVARSVEARRDSVVLIVTLDVDEQWWQRRPSDAESRARLAMIARVVQRLRPDVLIPADRFAAGAPTADIGWWQAYYERTAATARRVDRNITVALATDAASSADSALVDWVMQGNSPLDAIAVHVDDHGADPSVFLAALNAMTRWASLAGVPPSVWILGVPASPSVTGELAQQRLVRHTLAWGAAHAWVRGVVAGDASDAMAAAALRTAEGRSRRALAEVGAALRAARDLPPTLPADAPPPADSEAAATRPPRTDTIPPPQ